jgi:hypothetical protein
MGVARYELRVASCELCVARYELRAVRSKGLPKCLRGVFLLKAHAPSYRVRRRRVRAPAFAVPRSLDTCSFPREPRRGGQSAQTAGSPAPRPKEVRWITRETLRDAFLPPFPTDVGTAGIAQRAAGGDRGVRSPTGSFVPGGDRSSADSAFLLAAYPPRDRLPPSQPITPAEGSSNPDRLQGGLIGCCSLKTLSSKLDVEATSWRCKMTTDA